MSEFELVNDETEEVPQLSDSESVSESVSESETDVPVHNEPEDPIDEPEEPKLEEPKTEEPKPEEDPKTEEPKPEEEPKTEEPKTEEPKTEVDLNKFFTDLDNNTPTIFKSLLGGLLNTFLRPRKVYSKETEEDGDARADDEEEDDETDEDETDEEDEDEDEEDEDEEDEEEDEEEYEEDEDDIYLICENKSNFHYAASYEDAKQAMLDKFHHFLENNTCFLRIDKSINKISVYERNPNSLSPFNEQLIYDIEFFVIEKFKA